MTNERALSVSALNRYLSARVERDANLHDVLVMGEVSNCRLSGNTLYFTLSDEDSALRAIMFPRASFSLTFLPRDGMKVLARGSVNLHVGSGTYALIVATLRDVGSGDAHQAFLLLKERLEKEGLFSPDTKRPLPARIATVGLITAATGDAIHDITSTIAKRYPFVTIVLFPSKVQGLEAPRSLVSALAAAYRTPGLDCLILARGGGSEEDLAAFNDESLARMIKQSPIPLVTGIGHEADITIADLVADLRAPTPTGAAVAVTPDRLELLAGLDARRQLMTRTVACLLAHDEERLKSLDARLRLASPASRLAEERRLLTTLTRALRALSPMTVITRAEERLAATRERLHSAQMTSLKDKASCLALTRAKLEREDPDRPLERGYALVYQGSRLLTRAGQARVNEPARIRFADGTLAINVLKQDDKKG